MSAGVRLTAEQTEVQAQPGDRIEVRLQVRNTGTGADHVRLGVSGVPSNWASLDRTRLLLPAAASGTVVLVLHPPVGLARGGAYPLTLTATSEVAPREQATVLVTLTLSAQGGLRLALSPAQVRGRAGSFQVTLTNTANASATVRLTASDPQGVVRTQFSPKALLTVAAGETAQAALAVSLLNDETVGQARTYLVDVEAAPEGLPAGSDLGPDLRARGVFIYEPRLRTGVLPLWLRRLPAWVLLLAPLLLLAGAFGAGMRTVGAHGTASTPSTAPTGGAGTATTSTGPGGQASGTAQPGATPRQSLAVSIRPAGGQAVQVRWTSQGAGQVTLNGRHVAASGVQTLQVAGPQTLVLKAPGAGGPQSRILLVEPAFASAPGLSRALAPYLPWILRFTLARGAGGAPMLVWQVSGAGEVRLQGRPVPVDGKASVHGPGPYSLVASNHYGQVSVALAIPPNPPRPVRYHPTSLAPVISQFVLEGAGSGARLVWAVTGARTVLLNGKPVSAQGTLHLGVIAQGSIFDLVASNSAGTSRAQLRVVIRGGQSVAGQSATGQSTPSKSSYTLHLPEIVSFTVSASTGQVSWRVLGATHVALDGRSVPASGSAPISAGARSLTLVAGNDVGTQTRQMPVTGPTTGVPTAGRTGGGTTGGTGAGGGPAGTPQPAASASPAAAVTATSGHPAPPTVAATAAHPVGTPLHTPLPAASASTPSHPAGTPAHTPAPRASTTLPAATGTALRAATAQASTTATRPLGTATHVPHAVIGTATLTTQASATPTGIAPADATPTSAVGPAGVTPTGTLVGPGVHPTSTGTTVSGVTSTPTLARLGPATWTRTPTLAPGATNTPTGTTRTPTLTPAPGATSTATITPVPAASGTATQIPPPGVTNTDTVIVPPANATSTASGTPTLSPTPVPGNLQFSSAGLHFPQGTAGAAGYSAQTVTVTDGGPGPVTISTVSLSGTDAAAFAVTGCAGATLAAHASCTLSVSFTATTSDQGDGQGNYSAAVVLKDDAPGSPQQVSLSAGPRTIAASPAGASLVIANCAQQCSASTTVTVTNQGPGPLAGVSTAFSPPVPGFSAVASGCTGVAMFATCPVVVTFAPPAGTGGNPATTLVLSPQGGSGTASVQLNASVVPTATPIGVCSTCHPG